MPFFMAELTAKSSSLLTNFISNSMHCIFLPNYTPLALTFQESMENQKLHISFMVLSAFSSGKLMNVQKAFMRNSSSRAAPLPSDHTLLQPHTKMIRQSRMNTHTHTHTHNDSHSVCFQLVNKIIKSQFNQILKWHSGYVMAFSTNQ